MLSKVSIVMPTLNSSRTLHESLSSIAEQDFPKKLVEIIIADGGSTDTTLQIAKSFGAKIVHNGLKTGEAGKAIGLKHARGEFIAFIDSDNVLPSKDWLSRMIAPFADKSIACTEPIEYTWRQKDNYITRYCALMGLNDPFVYFIGNYDRWNFLDNKWTRAKVSQERKKAYVKARVLERPFPTIGANGFVARRALLKEFLKEDYFFDVDAAAALISKRGVFFAKANVGIIHLYSGSFSTFVRKQKRRIVDFFYFSESRGKSAQVSVSAFALLEFCIFTILVVPLFIQALIGFSRKQDFAWFFHIPASIATLIVYAWVFLSVKIFGVRELERKAWSQ